jgi:hypothetical protein
VAGLPCGECDTIREHVGRRAPSPVHAVTRGWRPFPDVGSPRSDEAP